MTEKEELELILRLMKKHGLPLSPILAYSIQERLSLFQEESEKVSDGLVFEELSSHKEKTSLCDYEEMFSHLSVSLIGGKKAPNKAILLLAIMHRIEKGDMMENKIYPNSDTTKAFMLQWLRSFPNTRVPSLWKPFYHLSSEPFYHFKEMNSTQDLEILINHRRTISIGNLRSLIQYSYLDSDLFDYMCDATSRARLRNVLIKNYIENHK